MGCGLCRVYCLVAHSKTGDIVKAFKRESPQPLSRIRIETSAEAFFPVQCRHCDEPWCVYSCLAGAMHRDEATRAVVVDIKRCIGCWTCILACPNGAIVQDRDRKVVAKCDLCGGSDVPACVANCPNGALMFEEDYKVGQLTETY